MTGSVFAELSIILVVVAIVSGIMRMLRQPLIIGYLLSGILLSGYFLDVIKSPDLIGSFSEIGVALLLFIVGLHMRPQVIKEVGKVSLLTGAGQVALTFVLGFGLSKLLGFSNLVSAYVGAALMFSSTIIVMKLLSDKKELDALHGKIAIGVLIFQDIVAVIALLIASSFSKGGANFAGVIGPILMKGALLIAGLVLISMYLLPRLNFIARSQEFLFLFSIGWGLGLATLFNYIGFSIEIGALIAGVVLSMSPYHYEISSRMRVLRDFFIILFFVLLGSQIALPNIGQYIVPLIALSLFVLVGHFLLIITFTGLSGYNKRTGFLTGTSLAQISEFSFILIALGVKVGHLNSEILSLITLVGFITILISTYLILYSNKLYPYCIKFMGFFEKKKVKKGGGKPTYDILLFGYNRIGYDFVESFKRLKKKFLVVDYNPEVILDLSHQKIECEYGDVDDVEFLNQLNLKKLKMVVSTIPNFDTNLLLVSTIRKVNKKAIVMCVSHHIEEAHILYEKGASYVVMPHFLGGKYASMMIDRHKLNISKFLNEKKKHMGHLKKRKELGHHHPHVEKNK